MLRTHLALLTSAALVSSGLGLAVGSASATETETEHVTNGSFQAGATGWTSNQRLRVVRAKGTHRRVALVTKRSFARSTSRTVLADLGVTTTSQPDTVYTARIDVKGNRRGITPRLVLHESAGLQEVTHAKSRRMTNRRWQRLSFTMEPVLAASQLDLSVEVALKGRQRLRIDNVSLKSRKKPTTSTPTTSPTATPTSTDHHAHEHPHQHDHLPHQHPHQHDHLSHQHPHQHDHLAHQHPHRTPRHPQGAEQRVQVLHPRGARVRRPGRCRLRRQHRPLLLGGLDGPAPRRAPHVLQRLAGRLRGLPLGHRPRGRPDPVDQLQAALQLGRDGRRQGRRLDARPGHQALPAQRPGLAGLPPRARGRRQPRGVEGDAGAARPDRAFDGSQRGLHCHPHGLAPALRCRAVPPGQHLAEHEGRHRRLRPLRLVRHLPATAS